CARDAYGSGLGYW
nr:immunoglobulin heavy chain junction region [Macaca mulatta]